MPPNTPCVVMVAVPAMTLTAIAFAAVPPYIGPVVVKVSDPASTNIVFEEDAAPVTLPLTSKVALPV